MPFALPADPATVSFLDKETVVYFHSEVLEPGQLTGFLNEGGLDSALGRVQSACCYDESADLVKLAAYYWHGISTNHGFKDGNKRTGFVSMVNFLAMNGLEFNASDTEMGALIDHLFEAKMFTLAILDEIIRTNTRPLV